MDMRILAATDGSPESVAALATAARLLKPSDRTIDLLCVAPRFSKLQRHREQYERRILRETTQILEKARRSIPPGSIVHLRSAIGSAARVIVHRMGDYDLTVIGPKGVGAKKNAGLGPVASRVVEHARGPLLIAREFRDEGGFRALFAVDGSAASCRAVETCIFLFDLTDAEICLMHVAETPWVHIGLQKDWESYDEEDKENSEAGSMEKELVSEGEVIIEKTRDLLRDHATSVSTRIDEGNPADAILSEADRGQYDLIVVGATGTQDLKHMMLGSVSTTIAWNASASVLIVRESE